MMQWHRLARPAQHAALSLSALIVLVPFFWVISAGFRTQISLLMGGLMFEPTLFSFRDVIFSRASDFVLNFQNSLIVGAASTVICLFVATVAAWSLHRMRWPRGVVTLFLSWSLLFHMLPAITLAGAWFTMFRLVHLDNTLAAIILAHVTLNLPMALWLMGVFDRHGAGGDRQIRPRV
jgi:multiple sugar transport system permease protein